MTLPWRLLTATHKYGNNEDLEDSYGKKKPFYTGSYFEPPSYLPNFSKYLEISDFLSAHKWKYFHDEILKNLNSTNFSIIFP